MKAGLIANLQISKKLFLLSGVFTLGLFVVVAYSISMMSTIGLKGPADTKASVLASRSTLLLLVIAGVVLLCAIALAIAISAGISRPARRIAAFTLAVADGDLTQKLAIQRNDEIGKLAEALNIMIVKMTATVASIQQTAEQVASSSEQISSNAIRLAEGAQNQASTLVETSASVEELSASVQQVSGNAQSQAAAVEEGSSSMTQVHTSIEDVSRNLSEIAKLAGQSVEKAMQGAKSVQQVMEGIGLISTSSEKIGGIVTVISDIADQTNLLALNASIEAARAGEHGRGFAVVADEVSKLADRSSASTKEIESLIKESGKNVLKGVEIAEGSHGAMEQIRAASQKVQEMIAGLSTSMSQQVEAIKELAQALENVSEMSQSISAATEQQTSSAKQVATAVEEVSTVTQSAAVASEQMSVSTERMTYMAQELIQLATKFRIPENGAGKETDTFDAVHIDKAIAAHGLWKVRLRDAIHTGKSGFQAESVRRDDQCEFGKWLSSLPRGVKETDIGRQVVSCHAQYHQMVAHILEQAVSGRKQEAERAMESRGELAALSSQLTQAMMAWKESFSSENTSKGNGNGKGALSLELVRK
jgi:methyl-accepting chemotaxis protein